MSWTDKIIVEEILKLQDEFNISTAVETGTFKGVNTELYAHCFKKVLSVEINEQYLNSAKRRLMKFDNVELFNMPSWTFLSSFARNYRKEKRGDCVLFYLDAHFYDPSAPPEYKWVVIRELRAIKGFGNCIIVIHDFDCEGLGHLCYDGEHLGWDVVRNDISHVNPYFFYYTNTKQWCDIYNENTLKELPITVDGDAIDGIRYANSSDEKRYRGILVAAPKRLDINKFRLKELER
jgi:hypothetical protein